jgi:hypothetical protein
MATGSSSFEGIEADDVAARQDRHPQTVARAGVTGKVPYL